MEQPRPPRRRSLVSEDHLQQPYPRRTSHYSQPTKSWRYTLESKVRGSDRAEHHVQSSDRSLLYANSTRGSNAVWNRKHDPRTEEEKYLDHMYGEQRTSNKRGKQRARDPGANRRASAVLVEQLQDHETKRRTSLLAATAAAESVGFRHGAGAEPTALLTDRGAIDGGSGVAAASSNQAPATAPTRESASSSTSTSSFAPLSGPGQVPTTSAAVPGTGPGPGTTSTATATPAATPAPVAPSLALTLRRPASAGETDKFRQRAAAAESESVDLRRRCSELEERARVAEERALGAEAQLEDRDRSIGVLQQGIEELTQEAERLREQYEKQIRESRAASQAVEFATVASPAPHYRGAGDVPNELTQVQCFRVENTLESAGKACPALAGSVISLRSALRKQDRGGTDKLVDLFEIVVTKLTNELDRVMSAAVADQRRLARTQGQMRSLTVQAHVTEQSQSPASMSIAREKAGGPDTQRFGVSISERVEQRFLDTIRAQRAAAGASGPGGLAWVGAGTGADGPAQSRTPLEARDGVSYHLPDSHQRMKERMRAQLKSEGARAPKTFSSYPFPHGPPTRN